MDARPWLNELRAELARRKLPPLYVERFVLELSDHFSDCMEDRMSTDAKDLHGVFQRLGSPSQVASSAAQEFRRAKFSRRHPVLMFVLMPVLSLPILWFSKIALVILLIKTLGIEEGKVDIHSTVWRSADAALPYLMVAMTAMPVAIAATCFCMLARRADVNWKWLLAACGVLAIVGCAGMAQITLPTATSTGSLSFGLGYSAHPSPLQMLQFLVPLAIGGWAIWRQVSSGGNHSQPA